MITRRSTLIGLLVAGTGAGASIVRAQLSNVAVTPQQFLAPAESLAADAGPAIRRALATGKPVRFPSGTYVVNNDPASAFDDGGNRRYSYCIAIPTGATLIFDPGAIIQGKAGLKNWTRIMVAINVSDFRIFGELKVDANVANRGTPSNEHMHGVLLFNATDFNIEAIDSRNARGDNVYIGGTDNTRGTCDGYIGRIYAEAAGRKCLVGQAFDNLHIGSVSLNNSGGGAAIYGGVADSTDGNCFDIEPDAWTGAIRNDMRIDYLYTKGAGNDFTAGTTATQGEAMTISIGKWDCIIVPRSTTPWYSQYSITINIDDWSISGVTAVSQQAQVYYAARLKCRKFKFNGATSGVSVPIFDFGPVAGGRPEMSFNIAEVTNTTGAGFEIKDAKLRIGHYKARTAGIALWARGLSSATGLFTDVYIDEFDVVDCGQPLGASYVVLTTKGGSNQTYLHIGRLVHTDTRMPSNNFIIATVGSCEGMSIGSVENRTPTVALFQTYCSAT